MLQFLSSIQLHKPQHSKQVRCILIPLSIFPSRRYCFATSIEPQDQPISPFPSPTKENHKDLSSVKFSGIAKSVISKCANLWDCYSKGDSFTNLSLKDYFLRLSNISPETIRRFWRVSVLEPPNVLEILLGFDCDSGELEIEVQKIESLWGVFKWASQQSRDFEHLPQSCKIMAKMLVRVGLFNEAECLLLRLDGKGIFVDNHEVFSDLIEGYVIESNLGRAVSNYNHMRRIGLAPSISCYLRLLEILVKMNETQLAHRVYRDMIENGWGSLVAEKSIYEDFVRLLCVEGRIQEARELVRSVLAFGLQPSNLVVDAVVSGYCEKKDYDDILTFLLEVRATPDVVVGNKVIYSLSKSFGSDRANLFMQELEQLGFSPDEITYGILIGQTCSEGRLKNAFIYISEMLSRCLKPHVYSYDAVISGLFKEGLWKQSLDIVQEMNDSGIMPNLSTFKVLLAGFCKARQFDYVKKTVGEMADLGLLPLSLLEDQLSTALSMLGVCPLAVKIRRDNDKQFSKTEFFDEIGNGLYLDTDLDGFDRKMDKVLENAIIPDFNSQILENYANRDIKIVVGLIEDMARWGQELSLSVFSTLLRGFSTSHISIKTITSLLEKMSKSMYQLDQGTLNMLVQKYSKRGFTHRAKIIFDNMIKMQMDIENETYAAFFLGLCKKGNLRSLQNCWQLALKHNWSPALKDSEALLDCLCRRKLLNLAMELLETILVNCYYSPLDVGHAFLEKLCCRGFTSAAYILAEELWQHGLVLDDMAYKYLISGFCKERKIAEALMTFDAMVAKNLDPPMEESLQLIPRLCSAGNFERAVALKEMCLTNQPSALLPVYCSLMNGFCKVGRVGEAASLFQEILLKGHLPDTECYNVLLQGYCQVNNLKKAGELLGAMIRKKLSISVSGYRNLVQLTCAVGKFSVSLGLKELMLKESCLPDLVIYNILIFHLSSAQNSVLLHTAINELQKRGLQLEGVTYDFIVRGASCYKDVSFSLQYLKDMLSEGHRPSNCTLRELIVYLCHHGELEKTLVLSEAMESRGWVHSSAIQNNIFEAFFARGKLQDAVKFLDRMEEKGLIPENINYDHIIKRLSQHGELEKAIDLLNIMLKKGNLPDSTSFDYLIQGFCICHKLEQALDYHTEMLYRNLTPSSSTWRVLVLGCSEVGQVAEAERLLHLMVQMGETPSREMYSTVVHKYRSVNNLSKATGLLQAMQQCGYEPDFETHWSLISNFSNPINKENSNKNRGFLSRLLSGTRFAKKDSSSNGG